jgi:hypothetical protein
MEANIDEAKKAVEKIGPVEEIAGLVLAVAGAVTFVVGLIRHSRLLRVLGLLLALAGGGFFGRQKLAERREQIDAAESNIRSELDDLDPVARAQVLADIAREQV